MQHSLWIRYVICGENDHGKQTIYHEIIGMYLRSIFMSILRWSKLIHCMSFCFMIIYIYTFCVFLRRWVSLLLFGEGWHNNHHAFEYSARMGIEWWQYDPGWYVIRFLQAIGVATHVKLPSQTHMQKLAND